MRGYKTLIQEAELMAMPTEAAAEFLKRRAGQSKDEAYGDPFDREAEHSLRGRADPLIDLALARYGRHMEVVSGLFLSSAPGSPIRLACLANRSLGHEIFQSFPTGLRTRARADGRVAPYGFRQRALRPVREPDPERFVP